MLIIAAIYLFVCLFVYLLIHLFNVDYKTLAAMH